MPYLHAVLLALLQALTEFLPVSSSGHLILGQHALGMQAESNILYDVLLHLATTVAVLVYLRRDVSDLLRSLVQPSRSSSTVFAGRERQAVGYILLATVPTGVIGLLILEYLAETVTRPDVVGLMLIITGTMLWLGHRHHDGRPMATMTARDAIGIGVIQGLAVLPGISRSGSTITGGILLGLDRDLAARFSLLIAVPAVLAASLLELSKISDLGTIPIGPYAVGMLVAGLAGYACIDLILRLVRRRRFYLFAYYLWPLGILAILGQYLG